MLFYLWEAFEPSAERQEYLEMSFPTPVTTGSIRSCFLSSKGSLPPAYECWDLKRAYHLPFLLRFKANLVWWLPETAGRTLRIM